MPARGADRRATDRDDDRRAEEWTLGRAAAVAVAVALAVLLWLTVRLERATHAAAEAEVVRAAATGSRR